MTPETNARLTRLIEGAGDANPFRKALLPSRPEEGTLDVATAFHGLENPAGGLPGTTPDGGPYAVKGGSWRFHGVKTARHAHDRMVERTPFPREHVDHLQRAVDTLGLKGEAYHVPLRTPEGQVAGYAQFKRVSNRRAPVLATVLGPHMTPGGENIEAMLKQSGTPDTNATPSDAGQFDTDHLDPRPPESTAWNRRHQHVTSQEPAHYAMRRAFDGVSTKPMHEIIEDDRAPSEIPDVT